MADVRPMRSAGDPQRSSGIPEAPTPVKRTRALGEILVDDGFITQEQLDEARRESEQSGKSLGRTLIDMSLVGEAALVKALATQIGPPFMDLADFQIDLTAASRAAFAGEALYGAADRVRAARSATGASARRTREWRVGGAYSSASPLPRVLRLDRR